MRADDFLTEGGLVSFLKKLGTDTVDYAVGKAPKVKNWVDTNPQGGTLGGRVPASSDEVTHVYRNMSPDELDAARKSGYFGKNPNPDPNIKWDPNKKYWSQGDTEDYFGRAWKDSPDNAKVRLPQDKLPRWTAGRTGDAEVLDKTTGAWNSVKENTDHDKDDGAVEELRAALLAKQDQLQSATDDQVYDIIDRIMTRIAKSHNISGKKLHDMWVRKYRQIPDTWIMTEAKTTREDFQGMTIEMVKNGHVLVINAFDDWGNNVLGSVAFNIGDDNELDPQDLKVDERYQGQGIARAMYDYAKSKGYEIHRSYDQTDAGKGFWDKHRGEEQRVWENNAEVEEGKKRKNKNASRSLGGYFFPGYGYYGSGESGESGGGESVDPHMAENFADGKNPGRKGLAKRMGVNTKASVSSLRKTAKNSSGEKQRMAHWLANMKSGRNKNK
jgi:GNAT superfamily N-acetyltransferase